jgi:hypothetical protein
VHLSASAFLSFSDASSSLLLHNTSQHLRHQRIIDLEAALKEGDTTKEILALKETVDAAAVEMGNQAVGAPPPPPPPPPPLVRLLVVTRCLHDIASG